MSRVRTYLISVILRKVEILIRFKPLNITVRYSFTRFNLILEIRAVVLKGNLKNYLGIFVSIPELDVYALPLLMRKVVKILSGLRNRFVIATMTLLISREGEK